MLPLFVATWVVGGRWAVTVRACAVDGVRVRRFDMTGLVIELRSQGRRS